MKNSTSKKLYALLIIAVLDITSASAQSWNLTGNAGTNTSTNFIGTTDAKSFKVRTNNSVRMTITSAGKFGIGTSTPLTKLHVVSSDGSTPRLQSPGSNTFASGWDFYHGTTGKGYVGVPDTGASFAAGEMILYGTTGVPISLWAGGARALTVSSNGNVGIGTTITVSKLSVVDPSAGTSAIRAENTHTGIGNGIGIFAKSNNNPGFGYGVQGQGGYVGVEGHCFADTYTGTAYGVYGIGDGIAGTRVGVYGTASGGTTNYAVYCSGSGVYTGTWTDISDQKFKKDLAPVTGALGLINQLNPVTYQLKKEEYPMMNFPAFRQYGFVAQELEKVIPLLVENGTHPGAKREDKDIEFKSVNYIGMIPILTKAIQEQQKEIDELKSMVQLLSDNKNKKESASLNNAASLEQNSPNPFSEKTVISFYIPENIGSAVIKIYSNNGVEIKSISISTKGFGTTEILAGALSTGIYTYMLITDGKAVDTKQMVLTK
ncbi:MAG: tail fiber domain-containing protein [Bacteroidia bacterium]